MKIQKYFLDCLIAGILLLGIPACQEKDRFGISSDDTLPPGQPVLLDQKALYGGVRFFYRAPDDKDLLSIDAEFVAASGRLFRFSASYFTDSLDVYGLSDTTEHIVNLYAVDRAGNKSVPLPVSVVPLEPAVSRVAKSIVIKPAFNSFFVDWQNELEQNINIYVDFAYTQQGMQRKLTAVFSSNLATDRRFVNDLYLTNQEPVNVSVHVEDKYGNRSATVKPETETGGITLLEDYSIPKEHWWLPSTNDTIGGEPMVCGDAIQGKTRYVIDGVIDEGMILNWMSTNGRGRTGNIADGNVPWNFMIDLGDYYELSRIVTHQSHQSTDTYGVGNYYGNYNVAVYNMYVYDDDTESWEYVSQHQIPKPAGLNTIEVIKMARAGDWAYMYPDDPKYTKPTRWFRFEALYGFNSNYTSTDAWGFSELTLYGRKVN
jgi:hypothetical protein